MSTDAPIRLLGQSRSDVAARCGKDSSGRRRLSKERRGPRRLDHRFHIEHSMRSRMEHSMRFRIEHSGLPHPRRRLRAAGSRGPSGVWQEASGRAKKQTAPLGIGPVGLGLALRRMPAECRMHRGAAWTTSQTRTFPPDKKHKNAVLQICLGLQCCAEHEKTPEVARLFFFFSGRSWTR